MAGGLVCLGIPKGMIDKLPIPDERLSFYILNDKKKSAAMCAEQLDIYKLK